MRDELMREHLRDHYGSRRTICPFCSHDRKKFREPVLSLTYEEDKVLYMCHHCYEQGAVRLTEEVHDYIPHPTRQPKVVEIPNLEDKLNDEQLKWLENRGISEDTASQCNLTNAVVYIKRREENISCIGFPYLNKDGSKAIKWRDSQKNFTQTGAANALWRIDQFSGGDLIITEGEMDALSFEEIGYFCTSVPNGAAARLSEDTTIKSKKFEYLWNDKNRIDMAKRVIIATDNDPPGKVLAEEIARRVGKAKCWRVAYPDDCKDANDVLVKHGPDKLREALDEATPWPIGGLRDAQEYKEDAMQLFRDGMDRGIDIGIAGLGQYYKPSPQTLTVCTGIPSSGKSTFLTWLSVQLASKHQWPCAVFSAETSSQVHLLQLAAIYKSKSFRGRNRMTEEELSDAIDWASNYFVFLDEAETSVESVIERAEAAVLRHGVRILMIDPYNFITTDTNDENGTHTINKLLVNLKTFAVEHDIAVWLVAHPTKMYRSPDGKVPVPGGYDISGSAAFFNVADNGLTVSRVENGKSRVTSWKARFPWIGQTGFVDLRFNPEVGSFDVIREWGESDEDWDL